jgi:peptidoglycan-associated lipoprotein
MGGSGNAWGASGMGGVSPAGTALPSAVGESRLASISTVTPPPIAPRDDAVATTPSMSRIASATPPPMAPRDDPAVLPSGMSRIVYFDFDSFVIRNEARPVIEAHARVLTADRARRMVIEGHTDDRGGREYNVALGQKRAEAVLRALVMLGASDAQLEAVSFGKERPAVQGADEAAWAQNRRAELKDRR